MLSTAGIILLSLSAAWILVQLGRSLRGRLGLQASTKMEEVLRERLGKTYVDKWGGQLEKAGMARSDVFHFLKRRYGVTGISVVASLVLACLGTPAMATLSLPVVVFVGVSASLKIKSKKRQRAITLALPYYLDLLTLALEAGLDLVAAIEEIVERDKPNPLQEELMITLNSIRVGTTRAQAFQDLADRTGLEVLSLLATSIAQAEELGAGMGQMLRLQSESLRRQSFSQAEEQAQKAPVKMLLPLIGLIFPVVFILLCMPTVIRLLGLP